LGDCVGSHNLGRETNRNGTSKVAHASRLPVSLVRKPEACAALQRVLF
jgi:hypothetical protein